jgi:cytochrome c biogenesis protein CcmG/thiol:disulfide interchange protein DsbE
LRVIQRFSLVIILAMALILASCSGTGQGPEGEGTAPVFTLQNLDGETVSLSDFRGKMVILNFWATWCEPCRSEMPFLQEVAEDTEWAQRGLVILAVNIGDSADAVRKFMADNGLSFTVLLDTTRQVGEQYNTRYIPTTYLIDKDGIIQNTKVGAFTNKSDIDRMIIDLLSSSGS